MNKKFAILKMLVCLCFLTFILNINVTVNGAENSTISRINISTKTQKIYNNNTRLLGDSKIIYKKVYPDNSSVKPLKKRTNIRTYSVEVNIEKQSVYVYYNAKLIKEMECSTGTEDSPTPTGTFYTSTKGTSFFSSKYDEGGYYWTSFLGNYLFHSVPFDENGNIIQSEALKLGKEASHGCIRLSVKDARWFFYKIPNHTLVKIS
jgi:lipoprotein-anchoring transpeptidase ErfK/SrfK